MKKYFYRNGRKEGARLARIYYLPKLLFNETRFMEMSKLFGPQLIKCNYYHSTQSLNLTGHKSFQRCLPLRTLRRSLRT